MALNNGNQLPFVTVMDCLNGYFSDPLVPGLAESFPKAANGGAIASFASSGLTGADPQHQMGERTFQPYTQRRQCPSVMRVAGQKSNAGP